MFVQVRDRNTGDIYSVDERAFREDAHELVSKTATERPRLPKSRLDKGGTRKTPVTDLKDGS